MKIITIQKQGLEQKLISQMSSSVHISYQWPGNMRGFVAMDQKTDNPLIYMCYGN